MTAQRARGPARVRALLEWGRLLVPTPTLCFDLAVLAVAAFVVQACFPHRHDWVGHVLAGGSLVIIADAVLGPILGAWSVIVGAWGVLGVAVVADLTLTGPFDPADVAFTVAGAMLVTGGVQVYLRPGSPGLERVGASCWVQVAWGLGLLAVAFYFRYSFRAGP